MQWSVMETRAIIRTYKALMGKVNRMAIYIVHCPQHTKKYESSLDNYMYHLRTDDGGGNSGHGGGNSCGNGGGNDVGNCGGNGCGNGFGNGGGGNGGGGNGGSNGGGNCGSNGGDGDDHSLTVIYVESSSI